MEKNIKGQEALVSVIIPVYNVEKYLELCLRSVINQTYSNLEILLIDDGSTDNSGKLCDSLKELDKRISVYHKENGGLSDARNYGMERATGDFYAFIDSDDVLHKDFFNILLRVQKQKNADIVSTDMAFFYDHNELEYLYKLNVDYTFNIYNGNNILKEYYRPSNGKRNIYHGLCMKIYKKELFDDLKFVKGRLHEDLFITYKLLEKSETFVYIDAPYYFYYQNNGNSISKNYGVKNFCDEYDACMEMVGYFDGNDNIREELYRFIIINLLDIVEKIQGNSDKSEVKRINKEIKLWINDNVWKVSGYSKIKKVSIVLSAGSTKLYTLLKKIRGVMNRNE